MDRATIKREFNVEEQIEIMENNRIVKQNFCAKEFIREF